MAFTVNARTDQLEVLIDLFRLDKELSNPVLKLLGLNFPCAVLMPELDTTISQVA